MSENEFSDRVTALLGGWCHFEERLANLTPITVSLMKHLL